MPRKLEFSAGGFDAMFDGGRSSSTSSSSSAPLTSAAVEFGAVAAAVLFAAHPMHTEAVSNVTNRSELLSFIAQLAGFLFFLHARFTKTNSATGSASGGSINNAGN